VKKQCLINQLSAGFDTLSGDPISHLHLTPQAFGWMTKDLVEAAKEHAGGRLVSVLEGGYDLSRLGACVAHHVVALIERSPSEA
jgi:acetoin utilization deacetylase AcuC-like enzyme